MKPPNSILGRACAWLGRREREEMPFAPIDLCGYSLAELCAPPADAGNEPEANFPLGWYEEFLQEIHRRRIEVITYRDIFAGCDDRDYRADYAQEYRNWMRTVRDRRKKYLLIQHDVDNRPHFTKRMVALEAQYGIRSNIFLFNKRWSSRLANPAYEVDHEFFQSAERSGYVIGYHQNALQLSGFDLARAAERYRQDVRELRKRYRIEFVVPHGGKGGSAGGKTIYNCDVPVPPDLEGELRWVFNGFGVTFHRRWSDGGLRRSRDRRRLHGLDLIGCFLQQIKPGERGFCLVHPQRWGYNVNPSANPFLADERWYQKVCRRHGVAFGEDSAAA